jgi:hypothetical protein
LAGSFKTHEDLSLIIKAFVISAFIAAQIGLYQLLTTDATEFILIQSTLVNPNQLSSFLFLSFPFTIFSMYFFTKFWSLFSSYVLASALVLIIYSVTRAVWLAIFFSSIVMVTLYFTYWIKNKAFFNAYILLHSDIAKQVLFRWPANEAGCDPEGFRDEIYRYVCGFQRTRSKFGTSYTATSNYTHELFRLCLFCFLINQNI